MGSVREILDRVPPPVLYHYTNQKGLLGILDSKEIWASHTQYLNDANEFRYAIKLVRKELERMIKAAKGLQRDLLKEMLEAVFERLEAINGVRMFVFGKWRSPLAVESLRWSDWRIFHRLSRCVLESRKHARKLLAGAVCVRPGPTDATRATALS